MKTRLTKKMLRALDAEISTDDVLYEKFRRLNEQMDRKAASLFRFRRNICVLQKRGKLYYALRVLDVQASSEGQTVIVDEN